MSKGQGVFMPKISDFFSTLILMGIVAFAINSLFLSTVPEFLHNFFWLIFGILTVLLLINILDWKSFFKFTAVLTSPFWIYALAEAGFRALFGTEEPFNPAVVFVTAPALVSVGAFAYWYLFRWQELSRTAIQPINLAVHLIIFIYAALFMSFTTNVAGWGLMSLAVSFFVTSFIAQGQGQKVLFNFSIFCLSAGLVAAILG